MAEGERSLAVFVDFENLALGFQGRRDRFEIGRVLERLVEKGKIVAKKAYADWNRFAGFTAALHEAAIELIEIPKRAQTGKNSADIRLCVDAMDLAYSKEHINTFVILSGDSDFSPLVSKLKELGKHVIGLGMQDSTSDLLRDNCDEFIYYEDLGQGANMAPSIDSHLPETKRKAFALLLESLLALRRENKEVLWSSMVKDTMKRKKPSFNETYHGYRTFSELLEDAQHEGLLELETDKRSRTYVVTRFGSEMDHDQPPPIVPSDVRPMSTVAVPPRVVPSVVVPPRTVPAVPGPAPRPAPSMNVAVPLPPPGMPTGEGQPIPGKKKSRRRRRRGQKDIVNGNNGSTTPMALQTPPSLPPREPRSDVAPVPETNPSFAEGLSLPPEHTTPTVTTPSPAPEPEPAPVVKAIEPPPPEPVPEPKPTPPPTIATSEEPASEPAPVPAPRPQRRKAATPRTTTSTRSKKASTGEPAKASTRTSSAAKAKENQTKQAPEAAGEA